ncbi:hypothetical protein FOBRF1_014695 [Fusarium oxysporum]
MPPTVVGVPGAWHIAESFDAVKKTFKARNYDFVSQNAPGLVDRDSSVTKDAESLRTNLLEPLVKAGKDVILMMHSYGGIYGSQAVQGLSKREREQSGQMGGIVTLIYVAALVPVVGKTAFDMMGMDVKNLPNTVEYNESTGFVKLSAPRETMYHDIPEEDAAHYISMLKPEAFNCFNTPVSYSPLTDPNFAGKVGFVICGADILFPLAAQERHVAVGGIEHTIFIKHATHAFFATAADETVDAVIQLSES